MSNAKRLAIARLKNICQKIDLRVILQQLESPPERNLFVYLSVLVRDRGILKSKNILIRQVYYVALSVNRGKKAPL